MPYKIFKDNSTICDIGAGAGFPSVPIAIINRNLNITACDSLNKRITFLNLLKEKLDISNYFTIHSRAEDFAKIKRESFDFVVARAVASLNTLAEYCLPLTKINGYMVAYKSVASDEEIKSAENAIKILGGKIENCIDFKLPDGDFRKIILIKKIKSTPNKYPRSMNKPKTNPL